MPFSIPTLEEINDRVFADLENRLPGSGTPLLRTVKRVFAVVIAGAVHGLYRFLRWAARQMFPWSAEGIYLDRWASFWDVDRKAATYASGPVDCTGTNGSTVAVDEILVNDDGVEYKVTTGGTIAGGVLTITVQARAEAFDPDSDFPGTVGNLAEGETLTFVSPPVGVDSQAAAGTGGITGGLDEETDEDLLVRLEQRLANPPQGGSDADYERWTLEVAGVTRVWVFRHLAGVGTVSVTFVLDNTNPIIPDGAKVTEVFDYLTDSSRAPTHPDNVTVFAPTEQSIAFTFTALSPDTAAVRAAIVAELEDLFLRAGGPGKTISLAQIRTAIGNGGATDYTLTAPAADVVSSSTQVPTVATPTWPS